MKKHIFPWLIRLLFVLLLSAGGYFGFLLWMKYGKSFSGEVNAAIVGGIIAIITMIVSSMTTYYTTQRSSRITVRDEIFRKRMEVYHQIYEYAFDIYGCIRDSYRKGDFECLIKGSKLREEMARYTRACLVNH